MSSVPSIPSATYRLQFHKGFTFRDALSILPYLRELGISHIYASPIFRASPGSMHGYDVCDHNEINPELGGRAGFDAFAAALRAHQMGLILDFVPNHMGISEAANGWWMDVLENGPSSPYARFFDIDWRPVKRELDDSVLLPILGDQYGRVLERGEFKLHFNEGAFCLDYHGRTLPIAPRTVEPILEAAKARLRAAGREVSAEFDSISYAIEHLPLRSETDPQRIQARAREKEVIKARLARLCAEAPEVDRAIRETVAEIEGGGPDGSFDALDSLLKGQVYRLAYWRVAAEEINYRRFFDISSLAAVRMELPEVFASAHRLVFDLLRSGAVTGLRIDHVDGLYDPRGYIASLQQHAAALMEGAVEDLPLYLLVEKILAPEEKLRGDWQVHGTTGYEVANQITSVLVDPAAEPSLTDTYAKFIAHRLNYRDVVYESKRLVMRVAMSSEVNGLGHMLNRISESNRWYRDFTLNALTDAIREVIACFPVYRTYLTPDGKIADEDARVIHRALATAWRRNPTFERSVFQFVRDVLLPSEARDRPVDEEARLQFVMKFQQCTGPITAKGVEDTSFYVYNRLLALNEVGGEPDAFGATVEHFHRHNEERLRSFPHSMVSTSTHDTKRSEDVRARIAALAEVPEEWARAVRRWHTANQKYLQEVDARTAPDANEEYMLYQNLIGSWPLEPMHAKARAVYVKRLQEFMMKALHEAKTNSSWIEPNERWDRAASEFIENILKPHRTNRFLRDFEKLAGRVAHMGMINSLSQTVLKFTIPGVPDVYQGQELWDFSLVDPDNRRPVDYKRRSKLMSEMGAESPKVLLDHWRDGRIKLLITQRLLTLRLRQAALFGNGSYQALVAQGEFANHCIAFARTHQDQTLLIIVPRLGSRVGLPPVGDCWNDTRLDWQGPVTFTDVFTGATHTFSGSIPLSQALADLPVAALVTTSPS
jgi:(1->4)-alpha-D-glucan 1-alpha-D-glucosylmutase